MKQDPACIHTGSRCPGGGPEHQDSKGALSKRRLLRLPLWFAGLASLIWFLIRVIPKPSRAAYPCQRAAAPAASAFVLWLCAVLAAKWALVQRRKFILNSMPRWALVLGVVGALSGILAVLSFPQNTGRADTSEPHDPLGEGKGIFPGRVVWVHAPDATAWDGYESPEYWWQTNHTDQAVVEDMMSRAVRDLTGQATERAAWTALFTHFNGAHGRGQRGYQPGEKIAIKLNLTTCNASGPGVDPSTYEKRANIMNTIDNSPQMVLSLVRHLVYVAGVAETNISLADPTAMFPQYLYNFLHKEFPGVRCWDPRGNLGREQVNFSQKQLHWSTAAAEGKERDFIPRPFADANYIINFALLKGHSAGVTLCAKNLYGAMFRTPVGYVYGRGTFNYYDLHQSLPNAIWSPGMGHYRALVDLMGHKDLGGKTMLYLVDGLFGGYFWDSHPYKWQTAPFGTPQAPHWPSSLLASQDPVAIDSVGYDLLLNEWPQIVKNGTGEADSLQGGAEDYLHEAAQADHPPSGTVYDPGKSGSALSSLGVHEHWNNPVDRKYSRNLGATNGIELLYAKLNKALPQLKAHRKGDTLALSWPTSQGGYTLQSTTDLTASGNWSPVDAIPATFQAQYVLTNEIAVEKKFYRLVK